MPKKDDGENILRVKLTHENLSSMGCYVKMYTDYLFILKLSIISRLVMKFGTQTIIFIFVFKP